MRITETIFSFIVYSGGTVLFLIILGSLAQVAAQEDDKRIIEIRRVSEQTNAQIEGSETYCSELVVNKNDKSWPAVGTYKVVYTFYFTFGDREKDPYPNRLVKATIEVNRAGRQSFEEFLFNRNGQLIFHVATDDGETQRFYFDSGKLIRAMTGQRIVTNPSRQLVESVHLEQKRLTQIFLNSHSN